MASTKRCEGGETVHKAQGESQAAEGGLRPAHAGGKRGAGEKPVSWGAECLCEEHPQRPVAGVREVAGRKEARYRS